jgi:hypothetical protein
MRELFREEREKLREVTWDRAGTRQVGIALMLEDRIKTCVRHLRDARHDILHRNCFVYFVTFEVQTFRFFGQFRDQPELSESWRRGHSPSARKS